LYRHRGATSYGSSLYELLDVTAEEIRRLRRRGPLHDATAPSAIKAAALSLRRRHVHGADVPVTHHFPRADWR